MDTFKVKNSWFEAVAMAMYEKWVSILDYAFMLLFISSFIPYFWGKDGEILMWGALFVALIDCVRIYSVARAIRQGRRARIEKTEFRHRKTVGAWMSVGWFFIFGVISVIFLWNAPIYFSIASWLMIILSVVGGVYLWVRRKKLI